MAYQVLARTWRPRTFSQIVGQQHVVRALTNGLLHNRLHHAFLFTGTRGVGKTSVARILAKALNCDSLKDGFDPCDHCDICHAIDQGRFVDLIEVDAASRTRVEDTRDLLDNVLYAPSQGRYKVYLIDEVHMLSAHSFNALLKTLEEPPNHVKFLLATTDPQKIPVTILSRCLQLNLKRLSIEQIQQQMQLILDKESIEYSTEALQMLSQAADGSMRDGLSLLDQAIVYGAGKISPDQVRDMLGWTEQQPVLALLRALAEANVQQLLSIVNELHAVSADFYYVLEQLIQRLHQLALIQFKANMLDESNQDLLKQLAETISAEDIQLYYQIALMGQRDLNLAPSPRTGMEMLLLRMIAFKPAGSDFPATGKHNSQNHLANHFQQPDSIIETGSRSESDVVIPVQQTTTVKDWEAIFSRLELNGLTKEFASHCTLQGLDEKQCILRLDPAHAHLKNETIVKSLQKAICDKLNSSLQLVIKLESQEKETLAGKRERIADEQQQAAQQAIEQDENVKALKQQFDAVIVPGSVEPIDDSGES